MTPLRKGLARFVAWFNRPYPITQGGFMLLVSTVFIHALTFVLRLLGMML